MKWSTSFDLHFLKIDDCFFPDTSLFFPIWLYDLQLHITWLISSYADINLILKTNCNSIFFLSSHQKSLSWFIIQNVGQSGSVNFQKIFFTFVEKNFKDPHKVVFFCTTFLLAFLHIQCHLRHTSSDGLGIWNPQLKPKIGIFDDFSKFHQICQIKMAKNEDKPF